MKKHVKAAKAKTAKLALRLIKTHVKAGSAFCKIGRSGRVSMIQPIQPVIIDK